MFLVVPGHHADPLLVGGFALRHEVERLALVHHDFRVLEQCSCANPCPHARATPTDTIGMASGGMRTNIFAEVSLRKDQSLTEVLRKSG